MLIVCLYFIFLQILRFAQDDMWKGPMDMG